MTEDEKQSASQEIIPRLKEEEKRVIARTEHVFTQLKEFSNRVSYSSSKAFQDNTAIDRIWRLTSFNPKSETDVKQKLGMDKFDKLDTFKFTGTFFLRDLAIMVHKIHELHPSYTIKNYNCLWFAGNLVQVLIRTKALTRESPEPAEKVAGRYFMAGNFLKYRTFKPNNAKIASLVDAIQDEIAKSDDLVSNSFFLFGCDQSV